MFVNRIIVLVLVIKVRHLTNRRNTVSVKHGLQTADYGLRRADYGLGIKHGFRYKKRFRHYGVNKKLRLRHETLTAD